MGLNSPASYFSTNHLPQPHPILNLLSHTIWVFMQLPFSSTHT
uniref:Uncharacterized protein n=1 Tax=Arundo donax TaxID=35708 RepID=A0A0A8Z3P5_ARUDO